MMRTLLSLTAFLLLAPPSARAETLTEVCDAVRDVAPVSSHYVEKVLERVEKGISHAKASDASAAFALYENDWAKAIGSAWAALLDARQTRDLEEEELSSATACLHIDLLLLDCAMEDVRTALEEEHGRGSIAGIRMLTDLLAFINDRKLHLRLGALDPLYADPTWGERRSFDPPEESVWCCPIGGGNACTNVAPDACADMEGSPYVTLDECTLAGCTAPEGEDPRDSTMCPFNADYAPMFESGFGCDVETLKKIADATEYEPMDRELEALEFLADRVKVYRESADDFLSIQKQIDELFGNDTTLPEPPGEREHAVAYGCGWTGGYCSSDPSRRCDEDGECGEGATCDAPENVCEKNRAIRCMDDSQCGADGPCVDGKTHGLPSLMALRSPFSLEKEQIRILSAFLGERTMQELSRNFSDELKLPAEFPADSRERTRRENEEKNPFASAFRASTRLALRAFSRLQGRKEAVIFPEAIDPPLQSGQSLSGLRAAVGKLSRLASEEDGLRGFVASYAYFINRTCIYRPCSLLLEQVIRIATTDACFPYANGAFLDDEADWEACGREADIGE